MSHLQPTRHRLDGAAYVRQRGRTAAATVSLALLVLISPRIQAQTSTSPPAPGAQTTAATADQGDQYNVVRATDVRTAPDAIVTGQLRPGASVQIVARDRGWVRVRTEGWVQERDLTPADTAFREHLSAADIRADPAAARGKMVRWTVKFLALQTADPLRQGLADEEPYMLAQGPEGENALLYLVVPPSLLGTARAIQPLTSITVVARVRDGHSEPVGIPILDLQSIRIAK